MQHEEMKQRLWNVSERESQKASQQASPNISKRGSTQKLEEQLKELTRLEKAIRENLQEFGRGQ